MLDTHTRYLLWFRQKLWLASLWTLCTMVLLAQLLWRLGLEDGPNKFDYVLFLICVSLSSDSFVSWLALKFLDEDVELDDFYTRLVSLCFLSLRALIVGPILYSCLAIFMSS